MFVSVAICFRSPFLCFDQLLLFPMATVDVRVIGESSPGSTGGSGGGFGRRRHGVMDAPAEPHLSPLAEHLDREPAHQTVPTSNGRQM